jgi:hypothetical protein
VPISERSAASSNSKAVYEVSKPGIGSAAGSGCASDPVYHIWHDAAGRLSNGRAGCESEMCIRMPDEQHVPV